VVHAVHDVGLRWAVNLALGSQMPGLGARIQHWHVNAQCPVPNKSDFRSRSLPTEMDSVYWALWDFMENKLREDV
jgi:hypothetical protein